MRNKSKQKSVEVQPVIKDAPENIDQANAAEAEAPKADIEPAPKAKGKAKGLVAKSQIRENGKVFNAGDKYDGENEDRLLEIGVIEKA